MTTYEELYEQCQEPECDVADGTVYACDYCGKLICLEHDDQPGNRGFDTDLVLCTDCGDKFDKEAEVCVHDVMQFTLDGKECKSCRMCMMDLSPEGIAFREELQREQTG